MALYGISEVNGDPSLFEGPPKIPAGFIYHPNFLAEAEEQELIREIQQINLTPFQYYQFTGKRRTASFGWQYEFGGNEITAVPDVPAFLLRVRARTGSSLTLIQTV
jgi:hypothetical protein